MRVQADTARHWIVISALIVGGVYAYRLLIEGKENVLSVPEFFTGWGATYFVMSVLPPSVGGPLALVVAAGDVLLQGNKIIADVSSRLPSSSKTSTSPGTPGSGSSGTTKPTPTPAPAHH